MHQRPTTPQRIAHSHRGPSAESPARVASLYDGGLRGSPVASSRHPLYRDMMTSDDESHAMEVTGWGSTLIGSDAAHARQPTSFSTSRDSIESSPVAAASFKPLEHQLNGSAGNAAAVPDDISFRSPGKPPRLGGNGGGTRLRDYISTVPVAPTSPQVAAAALQPPRGVASPLVSSPAVLGGAPSNRPPGPGVGAPSSATAGGGAAIYSSAGAQPAARAAHARAAAANAPASYASPTATSQQRHRPRGEEAGARGATCRAQGAAAALSPLGVQRAQPERREPAGREADYSEARTPARGREQAGASVAAAAAAAVPAAPLQDYSSVAGEPPQSHASSHVVLEPPPPQLQAGSAADDAFRRAFGKRLRADGAQHPHSENEPPLQQQPPPQKRQSVLQPYPQSTPDAQYGLQAYAGGPSQSPTRLPRDVDSGAASNGAGPAALVTPQRGRGTNAQPLFTQQQPPPQQHPTAQLPPAADVSQPHGHVTPGDFAAAVAALAAHLPPPSAHRAAAYPGDSAPTGEQRHAAPAPGSPSPWGRVIEAAAGYLQGVMAGPGGPHRSGGQVTPAPGFPSAPEDAPLRQPPSRADLEYGDRGAAGYGVPDKLARDDRPQLQQHRAVAGRAVRGSPQAAAALAAIVHNYALVPSSSSAAADPSAPAAEAADTRYDEGQFYDAPGAGGRLSSGSVDTSPTTGHRAVFGVSSAALRGEGAGHGSSSGGRRGQGHVRGPKQSGRSSGRRRMVRGEGEEPFQTQQQQPLLGEGEYGPESGGSDGSYAGAAGQYANDEDEEGEEEGGDGETVATFGSAHGPQGHLSLTLSAPPQSLDSQQPSVPYAPHAASSAAAPTPSAMPLPPAPVPSGSPPTIAAAASAAQKQQWQLNAAAAPERSYFRAASRAALIPQAQAPTPQPHGATSPTATSSSSGSGVAGSCGGPGDAPDSGAADVCGSSVMLSREEAREVANTAAAAAAVAPAAATMGNSPAGAVFGSPQGQQLLPQGHGAMLRSPHGPSGLRRMHSGLVSPPATGHASLAATGNASLAVGRLQQGTAGAASRNLLRSALSPSGLTATAAVAAGVVGAAAAASAGPSPGRPTSSPAPRGDASGSDGYGGAPTQASHAAGSLRSDRITTEDIVAQLPQHSDPTGSAAATAVTAAVASFSSHRKPRSSSSGSGVVLATTASGGPARRARPSHALNEDAYDFAIVVRAVSSPAQLAALARAKAAADAKSAVALQQQVAAAAEAARAVVAAAADPASPATVAIGQPSTSLAAGAPAAAAAATSRTGLSSPQPQPTALAVTAAAASGGGDALRRGPTAARLLLLDPSLGGSSPHSPVRGQQLSPASRVSPATATALARSGLSPMLAAAAAASFAAASPSQRHGSGPGTLPQRHVQPLQLQPSPGPAAPDSVAVAIGGSGRRGEREQQRQGPDDAPAYPQVPELGGYGSSGPDSASLSDSDDMSDSSEERVWLGEGQGAAHGGRRRQGGRVRISSRRGAAGRRRRNDGGDPGASADSSHSSGSGGNCSSDEDEKGGATRGVRHSSHGRVVAGRRTRAASTSSDDSGSRGNSSSGSSSDDDEDDEELGFEGSASEPEARTSPRQRLAQGQHGRPGHTPGARYPKLAPKTPRLSAGVGPAAAAAVAAVAGAVRASIATAVRRSGLNTGAAVPPPQPAAAPPTGAAAPVPAPSQARRVTFSALPASPTPPGSGGDLECGVDALVASPVRKRKGGLRRQHTPAPAPQPTQRDKHRAPNAHLPTASDDDDGDGDGDGGHSEEDCSGPSSSPSSLFTSAHKCTEILAALRSAGLQAKRVRSLSRSTWLIKLCAPEWRLELEAERVRTRLRRRDGGWSRFRRALRHLFAPPGAGYIEGPGGPAGGASLFHSSDRQSLINHILRSPTQDGGAELGESSPLGAYVTLMFPLHMRARLEELRSDWLAIWRPARSDAAGDRIGAADESWYAPLLLKDIAAAAGGGASGGAGGGGGGDPPGGAPGDRGNAPPPRPKAGGGSATGDDTGPPGCCCCGRRAHGSPRPSLPAPFRALGAGLGWLFSPLCRCGRSLGRASSRLLSQPLDRIAAYFGETVAFYFAWLEFYTQWLLLPSLVGALLFLSQLYYGVLDCAYAPLFSLFMALWSIAFLEFWKRRNAELAQRWGVSGWEDEELPRPAFAGDWKQDPRTGEIVRVYAPWRRAATYALTLPLTAGMVAGVTLLMILVYSTRDQMLVQFKLHDDAVAASAAAQALISQLVANGSIPLGANSSTLSQFLPLSLLDLPPQVSVLAALEDAWDAGVGGFLLGTAAQGTNWDSLLFSSSSSAAAVGSSNSSTAGGSIDSLDGGSGGSLSWGAISQRFAGLEAYFTSRSDWRWWLALVLPPVLLGLLMPVIYVSFSTVARAFNDWENHETESSHRNHLIAKVFVFRFMCAFLSLFYYAFSPQHSLLQLAVQLATFLIVGQAWHNALEVGGPALRRCCREWRFRRRVRAAEESGVTEGRRGRRLLRHATSAAWSEARMPAYDTFNDYAEMLIQFGHVTFFSWAFPLAPLAALLNNVLEMRADAYKLCYGTQRPIATKAGGIGVWYNVLVFMSLLAVLTNCAHLALNSQQFSVYFPGFTDAQKMLVVFVIEHAVLAVRMVLPYAIPPVSARVLARAARERHAEMLLLGRRASVGGAGGPYTAGYTLAAQPDGAAWRASKRL